MYCFIAVEIVVKSLVEIVVESMTGSVVENAVEYIGSYS